MLTVERAGAALERCWSHVLATLADLSPEQLSLRTRCPGWDVAALVLHLTWGVSMEADALRRGRTGAPGRAEGRTPSSHDPNVLRAALRSGVDELLSEVRTVPAGGEDRTLPLPYGDVPTALALQLFVMEAGLHTDDLACALGQEEDLDEDVVDATASALGVVLPAMAAATEARPSAGTVLAVTGPSLDLRVALDGDRWVAAGSADPTGVVTARDDSTALRFVLGRVGPHDPGLTVRGDGRVASEFNRWFPGP
ncbi:MAG: hypothetical protein QOE59_2644 [Actinomycetota bacterium]|nr:hypothetical protein [Actinomycetota bacterium]